MTPETFIAKWHGATLTERAAAQSHFIDLCRLLGEPTPTDADPRGEWYCFERGATKTTGGEGWADVWKRGCFGWEYKGKRRDLNAAFVQLQQ
ncbi:type IIL restriction-modification enzyme MmeI [Siccirubricoccus sp. G192]|uniref:type IIL restriction-modification enzyme MmeI n=1 Tax=Siccirubricoccus sp. G192 TaxID=2849651 RepID=UPI0020C1F55F|nr:type IIL restriction-modification enzyme MmeI [Siccirubricoccus sp. G192]